MTLEEIKIKQKEAKEWEQKYFEKFGKPVQGRFCGFDDKISHIKRWIETNRAPSYPENALF